MKEEKEDNSPLGIAEKGARMGKEWFTKNIEKDIKKLKIEVMPPRMKTLLTLRE